MFYHLHFFLLNLPLPHFGFVPHTMFVVEDHYQILPFVHKAIRKKKLKFEHLKLIHVDAHPDMMVLNFENADVVFSPHELYEGLEKSEYGDF